MDNSPKMLMISVKPRYAEKIFLGTKKVELRRIRPDLMSGDTVVVYVSSPIKQLQGTFTVDNIICLPLQDLWQKVHDDAGISKEEFDKYFSGANFGYGIYIKEIIPMYAPKKLDDLRKQLGKFNPPQSYRYLSTSEYISYIES